MTSYCEHHNETLGSIKGGKFLDYLSDYYILNKESALWSLFVWSEENTRPLTTSTM
jgi:hypothetical protein